MIPSTAPSEGFKSRVVRAGSLLIIRQVLGIVMALVGMSVLARALGPANYGLYVTAAATAFYTYTIFRLGIGVYLTRSGLNVTASVEQQAFTLLVLFGIVAAALLCALAVIGGWWLLLPFAITLPLQLLSIAPLARLERQLKYAAVARIELAGQGLFFLIAIPMALQNADPWAPALGWVAQYLSVCIVLFAATGFRPKLKWDRALIRDILTYSTAQAGADWLIQARTLVNPWIVGPIAGPEAVGIIYLTLRFIDALAFIQTCVVRMAVPVMGQMRGDRRRLRRVIDEGVPPLVIATAACFLAFTIFGPLLIDTVLGGKWGSLFVVFPYLAVAQVTYCVFCFHTPLFYVLGKIHEVAYFNIAYVCSLATGAVLFVPYFGAAGFGMAEVISIPCYMILDHFAVRERISTHHGIEWLWLVAFSIAFFWPAQFGLISILVVAASPRAWRIAHDMVVLIQHSFPRGISWWRS
jgi:O-antigen/teichoic acid export membrane protein